MKFLIVCVLVIALCAPTPGQFPPNFPKCANADEACLIKATTDVLQNFHTGIREIGLVSFDPLFIKVLHFERNPSSPVNIDLKLTDVESHGLKEVKITRFSGLNADLSGRNVIEGIIPLYSIKSHYVIDGRVLVLPITGEGTFGLTCKNMRFSFSFDLKSNEKNGKTHASLEHVKLELDPENVQYHFENLFNGDKALTDSTNDFLNTNWNDVFTELKPVISKSHGLVLKSVVTSFIEKFPYAEFFQ